MTTYRCRLCGWEHSSPWGAALRIAWQRHEQECKTLDGSFFMPETKGTK